MGRGTDAGLTSAHRLPSCLALCLLLTGCGNTDDGDTAADLGDTGMTGAVDASLADAVDVSVDDALEVSSADINVTVADVCHPAADTGAHELPPGVISAAPFAVSLTWETPGAPKICEGGSSDGKDCKVDADCDKGVCTCTKGLNTGADLDLHVAHDDAKLTSTCQVPPKICDGSPCYCLPDHDKDGETDPWFHKTFDVCWLNPSPKWGPLDQHPGMDLDDPDGCGPENISLKNAPSCEHGYTIGVHYWRDNGFGPSVATVRVYIWGELKATLKSPPLNQCDMWWVKRITLPGPTLQDVETPSGKITPGYTTAVSKGLGAPC